MSLFSPIEGKKLTKSREKIMLMDHGTEPWTLSPRNILQAARQDMQRKASNAELKRLKKAAKRDGNSTKGLGQAQGYTFLDEHVREAKDVEGLLRKALDDRGKGLISDNPWSVEAYKDPDRLARALLLEIGDPASHEAL